MPEPDEELISLVEAATRIAAPYARTRDLALRGEFTLRTVGGKLFVTSDSVERYLNLTPLQRRQRDLVQAIGHFFGVLTTAANQPDAVLASLDSGEAWYELTYAKQGPSFELRVDLVFADGKRVSAVDNTPATRSKVAKATAKRAATAVSN